MLRKLRTIAFSVLLASFLGGCLAGTPQGGSSAIGAAGETGDLAFNRFENPEETKAAEDTPHPGGVTAMPVEHGDDPLFATEGEVDPACRQASGKILFHLKGSVFDRRGEPANNCKASHLVFRFWNGEDCREEVLVLNDCRFDGYVASAEMSGIYLYRYLGVDVLDASVVEQVGHLNSSGETRDIHINPSAIGSGRKIPDSVRKLLKAPLSCKRGDSEGMENRLVIGLIPTDLGPCTISHEDMPRIPIPR